MFFSFPSRPYRGSLAGVHLGGVTLEVLERLFDDEVKAGD
jgi:hypothetical protein